MTCHPHVDNIVLTQIDLGRTARPFQNDKVKFFRQPPKGFLNLSPALTANAAKIRCNQGSSHLPIDDQFHLAGRTDRGLPADGGAEHHVLGERHLRRHVHHAGLVELHLAEPRGHAVHLEVEGVRISVRHIRPPLADALAPRRVIDRVHLAGSTHARHERAIGRLVRSRMCRVATFIGLHGVHSFH